MPDQLRLLNQDLVLLVKQNIDPSVFDLNRYEGFIDAFCGDREYQKDAIRQYQTDRFNIILKGRQLGFTTLIAAYALWLILQP